MLAAHQLSKSFYGVHALDHVDFELGRGEVHGLLGENGAGKSTLCSILAGLYRADSGEVRLDGERVDVRSPVDASRLGIGMVYQHFRLVDSFTVAENVILGTRSRRPMRDTEEEVAGLAERYGFDIDPTARIWQLSVGEQQRVEILRQLFRGARVLILDEPTAVLAPHEVDRLFDAVRQIASDDRSVILVSHKMREILGHTDRVTVLRRGANAGSGATDGLGIAELRQMMFGTIDHQPAPRRDASEELADRPVLEVDGLEVVGDRGVSAVVDVDLTVRRGEIVGVAGVAGNGQRELQEALAGLRRARSGTVVVDGIDCSARSSRGRSAAGLAYVPEDRLGTALAPGLTLDHNVVLKSYRRRPHSRFGFLRRRRIAQTTQELTEAFDVRGARAGLQVSLMSGGNLQKAILGREITADHEILLAAAPTRGLDLSAAGAVRDHLMAERAAGRGVLVFSEDLNEVVDLADVVLVMFQGRIVGRFTRDEVDLEAIGLLMTGGAEAQAS